MTLGAIFDRRLRLAVAGLWLVGVGLAGFTAVLSWRRISAAAALPFIAVVVAGMVLIRAVLRSDRWALILSTVLLGAQLAGVIGSAWELTHHVSGSKSAELRRLGFDPRFGVALNLVYSAVAFAAFGWVAARWRAGRRRPYSA